MKYDELRKISKLYFGYEEIARVLGISEASARVSASRYVTQGLLLRLKKNLYVLRETWNAAGREDKFLLANMGQVPSYISLTTALAYYDATTQVQREYFESVAIKRTRELQIDGTVFRYTRIAADLYSGFVKTGGFFIATPEKALIDAFYLMSYGRYTLDISALEHSRFEPANIKKFIRPFPLKTKKLLEKHGFLSAA